MPSWPISCMMSLSNTEIEQNQLTKERRRKKKERRKKEKERRRGKEKRKEKRKRKGKEREKGKKEKKESITFVPESIDNPWKQLFLAIPPD